MQASGQTDLDRLCITGDWYPSSGEAGLEELLQRYPDLEAVFACNDPMAAGALQAARRLGRRVPADLAVVGFDDVPEAAFYYPALTTIRQPLTELGGQAVDLLNQVLQAQVDGLPSESPPVAWGQPQLVIRQSTTRSG